MEGSAISRRLEENLNEGKHTSMNGILPALGLIINGIVVVVVGWVHFPLSYMLWGQIFFMATLCKPPTHMYHESLFSVYNLLPCVFKRTAASSSGAELFCLRGLSEVGVQTTLTGR